MESHPTARGTEEHFKQHCRDQAGFHIPERFLNILPAQCIYQSCAFSAAPAGLRRRRRDPCYERSQKTAGRELNPFWKGGLTTPVQGATVAPAFSDLVLGSDLLA